MSVNIGKRIWCLLMALVLFMGSTVPVFAKNAGGVYAFDDLSWDKILEEKVTAKSGVVQAICATEDYIICLENSGDSSKENDIAYAYYKNPWDENGNPVEQYSLAFTNDQWDWEHCNGMCYVAGRDEIYVALYTNHSADSRGCIYVMDPHTLDYKGCIKLSDDWNVLGIGYYEKEGRFIVQTNNEDNYSVKVFDGNFKKIGDMNDVNLGSGSNSQDMCVCGEYIINFPLTFDQGDGGSYMNVYTLEFGETDRPETAEAVLLGSYPMELETDGNKKVEPESICEIEDGVFMCTVNIMNNKGKRHYAWYKTELNDYYYEIKTECSNGTITDTDSKIQPGTSEFTVTYKADDGYEISSIMVDYTPVDIGSYLSGYTFTDINEDHRVEVVCTPIGGALEAETQEPDDNNPDNSVQEKPQPAEPVIAESPAKEKAASWKVILLLVAILAAAGFGFKKYVDHVRVERRKKEIRRKLQRNEDRKKLREEEDALNQKPVRQISLQEALMEIDELESDSYRVHRRKK